MRLLQFRTIGVALAGILIVVAACSGDGDNGNPMSSTSPFISRVSWTHSPGCTPGTASDVTISVTVTDSDNAVGELTFSGFVSNCTGSINGPTSVVRCPQVAQYNGRVTVTDPAGNSDSLTFAFGPCEDGQVTK